MYQQTPPVCQADTACQALAVHVHIPGSGWELAPTLMSCATHDREARKVIGQRTTAVIFTYRLATLMPDPTADRPVTAHHSPGHPTERIAADLVRPKAGTLRLKALLAFRDAEPEGLTDEELAFVTETYLYSIAPRRGELATDGWVMDSGRTRQTSKKRPAIVWVLTGEGLDALGVSTVDPVGVSD